MKTRGPSAVDAVRLGRNLVACRRQQAVDLHEKSCHFHHVMKSLTKNSHRTHRTRKCPSCRKRLKLSTRGRPKLYCSASCRQRAYEHRKSERLTPTLLLERDFDQIRSKAGIQRVVMETLREVGLLPKAPASPAASRLPDLVWVTDDENSEK